MLNHQTIEGLHALRLPAMAAGLQERPAPPTTRRSASTGLGLLVDRELTEREDRPGSAT